MNDSILGIHHVTAISGEPQRLLDFYGGVLGMRLVKLTVNYDDPGTYHLYFADHAGRPGTAMTFFPWPAASAGVRGTGQVLRTAFDVPAGSFEFWRKRLGEANVSFDGPVERFGERVLSFPDPDGLELELVACDSPREFSPWPESDVPAEHAIRGFHSVSLAVQGFERSAALLTGLLGFSEAGREEERFRFKTGAGGSGAMVDLLCMPDARRGRFEAGTVHHVAWRVRDPEIQETWRKRLVSAGLNVTPVLDRTYFQSLYFREPGGVIFELATDGPGFTVDEPLSGLGAKLVLPKRLESHRGELERVLPPLRLPQRR